MLAYMWLYPPPKSETAQAKEQEGNKGGFPCFHFALAGEGTATQMSSLRCKFKLETQFSYVDY